MLRIIVICVLVIIFWKLLVALGFIGLIGTGFLLAFLLENFHFLLIWGVINSLMWSFYLRDLMNNPDEILLKYLGSKIPYWGILSITSLLFLLSIFIFERNLLNSHFQSLLTSATFFVNGICFLAVAFKLSPLNSIIWSVTSFSTILFIAVLNLSPVLSYVLGLIYVCIAILGANYFYIEKPPVDETPVDPLKNIHRYQPPENIKSESGMYCYHCGKKMGIDSLKYAEKRYCANCEKLDLPIAVEKSEEAVQPKINQLPQSKSNKSINYKLIIGIFVSIVLVLVLFQLLSGSKNDEKLTKSVTSSAGYQQTKIYDYDKRIELTGTLVSQRNNDIEKPFNFIAIRLDQPISFKANNENEAESNIFLLQLAYDDVVRAKATKNLNKKIKLIGTPFHSFSAHHATKVLISVDSIHE